MAGALSGDVKSREQHSQSAPPSRGFLDGTVDVASFPSWPAPHAIVHSKKNYRGRSQRFGVGKVPHLRGTRIGDNAITSVQVEGGARLTLFLKPNFVGRHETFTADCPSLKGRKIRNNRASSLRVDPPDVGPVVWRTGPVVGLAVAFTVERRTRGVTVWCEGSPEAYWIVPSALPPGGASLEPVVRSLPGLVALLGRPSGQAVTLRGEGIAVQLFRHGVVVYVPRSRRGWYRLDP